MTSISNHNKLNAGGTCTAGLLSELSRDAELAPSMQSLTVSVIQDADSATFSRGPVLSDGIYTGSFTKALTATWLVHEHGKQVYDITASTAFGEVNAGACLTHTAGFAARDSVGWAGPPSNGRLRRGYSYSDAGFAVGVERIGERFGFGSTIGDLIGADPRGFLAAARLSPELLLRTHRAAHELMVIQGGRDALQTQFRAHPRVFAGSPFFRLRADDREAYFHGGIVGRQMTMIGLLPSKKTSVLVFGQGEAPIYEVPWLINRLLSRGEEPLLRSCSTPTEAKPPPSRATLFHADEAIQIVPIGDVDVRLDIVGRSVSCVWTGPDGLMEIGEIARMSPDFSHLVERDKFGQISALTYDNTRYVRRDRSNSYGTRG